MKKTLLFLIILISQLIFSQKIALSDNQNLEIKKIRNIKSDSKKKTKVIIIQCVITSLNNTPVDINAFSLLDTENKVRYRLLRYYSWKGKSSIGFGHSSVSYLKDEILDKKGKPFKLLPKYDPSIKDSFEDYSFDGYKNCEIPLDFGSNKRHSVNELFSSKRRLVSVIYFPESKWKKFFSSLQFPVVIKDKEPKLEFYYKKKMISKIKYK
ncbi:MAG: hypothetical protein ABJU54_02900 [Gilvibacter sp.]